MGVRFKVLVTVQVKVNRNRNTPHVIGFMACVGFAKDPGPLCDPWPPPSSIPPNRPDPSPHTPATPPPMYVCMHVCMYVCMDGWMDGWMDVCMYVCMYVCTSPCIRSLYQAALFCCFRLCGCARTDKLQNSKPKTNGRASAGSSAKIAGPLG